MASTSPLLRDRSMPFSTSLLPNFLRMPLTDKKLFSMLRDSSFLYRVVAQLLLQQMEKEGEQAAEGQIEQTSVEHPQTEEHHISFILLETNMGIQSRTLAHNGKPEATFLLQDGEKAIAVYEMCNLHGLWKVEL